MKNNSYLPANDFIIIESMDIVPPINNTPLEVVNDDFDKYEFIPDEVYANLPSLLKDSSSVFKIKRERDVFLTGALSVIGGCFKNVNAYSEVDKTSLYPNLFSFIVAPPASGKRALKYAKKLIKEINDYFINSLRPKETTFLLPVNNSQAGVIKLLDTNDGCGVMIESEIDTLANTTKQEWGDYSDMLRNSFDNENYQYYRKSKNELITISKLKFSLAISGTPEQFIKLIRSTENGLFSRGCYYIFNDVNKFQCFGRVQSEIELDQKFAEFAQIACSYFKKLVSIKNVRVIFSEEQLSTLNNRLEKEYNDNGSNIDIHANIKRAFIIAQKIATVLTILEKEIEEISPELNCTDKALNTALELSLTYLYHSYKAYEILPKKYIAQPTLNAVQLLKALPDEFTRTVAVNIGVTQGLGQRTIDKLLAELLAKNHLIRPKYGLYKKCS